MRGESGYIERTKTPVHAFISRSDKVPNASHSCSYDRWRFSSYPELCQQEFYESARKRSSSIISRGGCPTRATITTINSKDRSQHFLNLPPKQLREFEPRASGNWVEFQLPQRVSVNIALVALDGSLRSDINSNSPGVLGRRRVGHGCSSVEVPRGKAFRFLHLHLRVYFREHVM